MKLTRQKTIRKIIEANEIETQEDLTTALKELGISVTQATVSRDIKEMLLVKIPCGGGRYRYTYPQEKLAIQSDSQLSKQFQDNVEYIDYSGNMIVIKTAQCAAKMVACSIDMVEWEEIIGTIAGEDTVFAIIKPAEKTEEIVERLSQRMSKR